MINVNGFLDNLHDAIQEIKGMSTGRIFYYDELGKALMGTDADVVAVVEGINERRDFSDMGSKTQKVFKEIVDIHIARDTESMEILHMIGRLRFLDEHKCKEDEKAEAITQKYLGLLIDLLDTHQISDEHAHNLLLLAKERVSNYGVICAIRELIANLSCATVRDLYNSALDLVYNTPEGRDQAQQIVQKMQNILDAEIDGLIMLDRNKIKQLHLESRDIIGVLHRIAEYQLPSAMQEQIRHIQNKYSEQSIISRVTARLIRERGLSRADTIFPESDEFHAPNLNDTLRDDDSLFRELLQPIRTEPEREERIGRSEPKSESIYMSPSIPLNRGR